MTAEQWNARIGQYSGSYLQSWEWGAFQHTYGRPVERFWYEDAATQVIVHALPAGRTYLFSPYGPVGQPSEVTVEKMIDDIQHCATTHQAIFWRYERLNSMLGGEPVSEVHPSHTIILRLDIPDIMLANMKPKWRYNIRLAQRKGVEVYTSTSLTDLNTVYSLLAGTAKRQGIRIHPQAYYQVMLDTLGSANMAKLYLARYNNRVIAANIMIGFGNTMTYVHGGTDNQYRQVMAPHLLQWQAMIDAHASGYTFYDWFGVAPADQPNHPWAGITTFKLGFGGERVNYSGTFEMPLNTMWYNGYKVIKHARSWI